MKIRIAFGFLLPLTFFVFNQASWACSCGTPSPYEAFHENATIFVGTPVSMRTDTEYHEVYPIHADGSLGSAVIQPYDIRIYRFEIEDSFKGRTVTPVEITTGEGGCGYGFEIGIKYLVFANRTKNKILTTSICDRTRSLDEAPDDLEILHQLKAGIVEARVFGIVRRWRQNISAGDGYQEYVGGITDALVTAKSKTASFETTTDSQGRFRFIDLPIDAYTIDIAVPNGKNKYGPKRIEVTKENRGGELHFYASIDAHISGRIFDFEGNPTNARVSLVRVEIKDGQLLLKEKLTASTAKDDGYEFEGIPPGRYVIGVSIVDGPSIYSPYTKTFYPQTPDLDKATIIDAKEGEQLSFDLKLFPPLPLRTFRGTVVRADGKFRQRVSVQLFDMDGPAGSFQASEVNVDEQGRFEIKGFADHRYCLHAYEVFYEDPMQSELVPVPTDGDTTSIKLVISKQGYKAEQPKP